MQKKTTKKTKQKSKTKHKIRNNNKKKQKNKMALESTLFKTLADTILSQKKCFIRQEKKKKRERVKKTKINTYPFLCCSVCNVHPVIASNFL